MLKRQPPERWPSAGHQLLDAGSPYGAEAQGYTVKIGPCELCEGPDSIGIKLIVAEIKSEKLRPSCTHSKATVMHQESYPQF